MDAVTLGNHLNEVWNRKTHKIDFADMEFTLVDVLRSHELTDSEKVAFCKETVDAFTRRGYFHHSTEYPEGR